MQSFWSDDEAKNYTSALEMRVYTSRLLGKSPELVLHGGGNTSLKDTAVNLFGESEDILYVKGSGWDLSTIEKEGFAPVKMRTLLQMAELNELSDTDMVTNQRAAMTDPNAPNPSIEAILHAIIPFKYVDHTHADSVVAITNTKGGEEKIKAIYGERVIVIPYVMPGFILAIEIYKCIKGKDLSNIDALILMNHGVFTFDDDARRSYEKMIAVVTEAEVYIAQNAPSEPSGELSSDVNLLELATIRAEVSALKGSPMVALLDRSDFAAISDVESIATRGPLTPDHVIRTKRNACIINKLEDVWAYGESYRTYFERNNDGTLTCLDTAPRWGVWKNVGTLAFGSNVKEARIISDIKRHTMAAIRTAEAFGGYKALPEDEIFKMEYWELEQAKLKKGGSKPEFTGKVALVTGAASGIGKACVEDLLSRGACVVALDINPAIETIFNRGDVLGITCDLRDKAAVKAAVEEGVMAFGGLDILINNAGIFPPSMRIEDIDDTIWQKSLDINLTAQQFLLSTCIPYLKLGCEPAVIFIVSKNVPAPGVGASAYSVAKAGINQLARIAAMELAPKIRVQMIHPDAVFDTGLWSEEILQKRAANYGLSVQEYKTRNLLKIEVESREVAALASHMAGKLFLKSTGVQIPIDGGNDRVI